MAPTNALFDHYENLGEQGLHDDLIVEAIEIYGEGMKYLPRKTLAMDEVLNEDAQHYFDQAIDTVFYIRNVEGFQGQGNFLSQIGLEIRDQVTLTVANTIFMADVGTPEGFTRPREGDLVYFPLNQKVFEITYVEKFQMFFPLGALHTYDITCQLFEYSGEKFTTGIEAIDSITELSQDLLDWAILAEDGTPLLTEDGRLILREGYDPEEIDPADQSDEIQEDANGFLDFTVLDPFSEGRY